MKTAWCNYRRKSNTNKHNHYYCCKTVNVSDQSNALDTYLKAKVLGGSLIGLGVYADLGTYQTK